MNNMIRKTIVGVIFLLWIMAPISFYSSPLSIASAANEVLEITDPIDNNEDTKTEPEQAPNSQNSSGVKDRHSQPETNPTGK